MIVDYFWPRLPADISNESKQALKNDLKESSGFFDELSENNRNRVSLWVRMKDKESRSLNREWLSRHSLTFFKRWLALSAALLIVSWLTSGILVLEVPTALGGIAAGMISCAFLCAHRNLGKG